MFSRARAVTKTNAAFLQAVERTESVVSMRHVITVARWHTDTRAPIPVVLLHGMLSNGVSCWGPVMKEACDLPAHRLTPKLPLHIYSVDLRCHGLSAQSGSFDVLSCTRDVSEFLKGINAAKASDTGSGAVIIGTGLGGQVALSTALAFPKYVRGVVGINCDLSPMAQHPLLSVIGPDAEAWHSLLRGRQSLDEVNALLREKIPNDEERRALLYNIEHHNSTHSADNATQKMRWAMDIDTLCKFTSSPLPLEGVQCLTPTLLLQDIHAQPSLDNKTLLNYFPKANVVTLENFGGSHAMHALYVSRPKDVVVKALDYFQLLSPADEE